MRKVEPGKSTIRTPNRYFFMIDQVYLSWLAVFRRVACYAVLRRAAHYGIFLALTQGLLQQALAQDAQQTLAAIADYQHQLDSSQKSLTSDLKKAQTNNADNAADLLQWQTLAEQFIFRAEVLSQLRASTEEGRVLTQQNATERAQEVLLAVKEKYQRLIENFALIGESIAAEKRAELTRVDSKMYFDMRVRSKIPPKTLKAYGVMEIAKQQRDQGNFAEAIELWEQAEAMVRESFEEHIAEMAAWRETEERNASVKQQEIKIRVEALLADHFVEIPAGTFLMGSDQGGADETPVHKVTLPAFKLGKTEVTFTLYDLCVESTRCYSRPGDEGWGRGERPVINVSYRDITHQFLPWLNQLTGRQFRLPSEAEWEYAARAGSKSEYTWGDNINCSLARYDGGVTSTCHAKAGKSSGAAAAANKDSDNSETGNTHGGGAQRKTAGGTLPVASYKPNTFGLYDMHGNVWEWVEDCWNPTYAGAPNDGSAWTSGNCAVRVLRGGSWDYPDSGLRSANRYYFADKIRKPGYGFRLALDN